MTTAQVEQLLGGCDDGTDSTRDLTISPTECVRIEDHEALGDGGDAKPTTVTVLRLAAVIEGTGIPGRSGKGDD